MTDHIDETTDRLTDETPDGHLLAALDAVERSHSGDAPPAAAVMARIRARFPEEDVKKIEEMLDIISGELMPEIPLPRLSPRT